MLSPYEQVLTWYTRYHESYGWTVKEVDESDLETLIDELIVAAKKNQPRKAYIENVLPL